MNRFYLDQDRVIEADMSSDASLHTDDIHKVQGKIGIKNLGFYFSLYCQQIKKQINKQLNLIVRDFYSHTQMFLDDLITSQYSIQGTKFINLLKNWRPKMEIFQQKYLDFKTCIPSFIEKKKSRFQQPRKIRFLDILDKILNLYESQAKYEQSTNAIESSKMDIQVHINKIQQLYDQNRFEQAIGKVKQLGKHVKSPQLYFILGNCYKSLQYYDESIHEYSKAINISPLGCYYNNRGNAYLASQQVSKAEADYKKAIDLEPMNEVYLGNYGNICLSLKKFEKSIEVYNQALRIDPNNDVFYNNRAFAEIKLKCLDDAIESYNKALKLSPTNHIYLKNRANLFMEKKNTALAIDDIKKALEIEPKHQYYFLKGKWEYLSNKTYDAMNSFGKAIKIQPNKQIYQQYYRAICTQLGYD